MNLIEDLVAAYRILAEHGVIDAYGHVSVRSERDPKRYFLSRSLAPELVMPEDIMEYDLDSNPIDVRGRESVRERFIHGEIFKARPDVNAVVHNHSPSVVPFSVTTVAMRPVFHMAAFVEREFRTSKSAMPRRAPICWSRRLIWGRRSPGHWEGPRRP